MKKLTFFLSGCILLLASTLALADQVNINTANAEELASLDGIGQVRAEAIIQHREDNGRFGSIEQLTDVSGIGEGILSNIADQITVGDD